MRMIRLADYFVIVGYDTDSVCQLNEEQADTRLTNTKILQSFCSDPSLDQIDSNINLFCQPHRGCLLYKKQEAPTFFVSVLTDIKGERRYLSCLTFLEPYNPCQIDQCNELANSSELLSDEEYDLNNFKQTNLSNKPIEPCRLYTSKSLVLVSKLDYTDLFKSCLSLIYAVYVDKRHNPDNRLLELIISNLLTCLIPSPGSGLCIQFSLGADDKHIVQSTATLSVPSTGSTVYKLFQQIGISNVLKLVCAVISDFKILFFSKSYTKLYESCHALESLIFPLKFAGVYVPVLPCVGSFLDIPAAPTPYIIGVHSSFRNLIENMNQDCLSECVKVDLDSSSVKIPDSIDDIITSSKRTGLPEYLYESTLNLLFSIMKPDILHSDELVAQNYQKHDLNCLNENDSNSDSIWLDKLIRAVFVRMFSQLFAGYRYCLLIIRINPKPVICFNKASFLGHHGLLENEFMSRLLDSMSFQRFIEERGPSYRNCDVFDDLYAEIHSNLIQELEQQDLDLTQTNSSYYSSNLDSVLYQNLKNVAEKLFKYEFPYTCLKTCSTKSDLNGLTLKNYILNQANRSYSKFKPSTIDAYKRLHSEPFPILDIYEVDKLIKLTQLGSNSQSDLSSTSSLSLILNKSNMCRPHLVPYGPPIEMVYNLLHINKRLLDYNESICLIKHSTQQEDKLSTSSSSRKIEIIEHFIKNIFENNFKDLKKDLNSAFRSLKDPNARLSLCLSLKRYVKKNQVILNHQQFEYVAKLLNEALNNDSRLDENGIAYSILPLSNAFYRKLNNNTIDQCIYTRLQDHDVWSNMLFWEMAFYNDVQRSIRAVYLSNEEFAAEQSNDSHEALNPNFSLYSRPMEKTALEICGEQMEKYSLLNQEQRESFIQNEQGIIRSHVLHYITQMVNMKIPLDINSKILRETCPSTPSRSQSFDLQQQQQQQNHQQHQQEHKKRASTLIQNLNQSITSEESLYDFNKSLNLEEQFGDVGYQSFKFISKFIDRVCLEGNLSDSQRTLLHQNLADVIRMQIETLDLVYQESKLVPIRIKPKLDQLKPDFLLADEFILEPTPLRCFLAPDGREDSNFVLPAEGAVYLTNYRLVFRGVSLNETLNDSVFTRSFPISSLTKEKKINSSFKLNSQNLQNGVQLRSNTFQLIKIYFDEEVTSERVEKFRSLLVKLRYPGSICELYCFMNQSLKNMAQLSENINTKEFKNKPNTDLKQFAKNTLRKAGLMPRNNNRKLPQQQQIRTPETNRKILRQSSTVNENDSDIEPAEQDSLSVIDENLLVVNQDLSDLDKLIDNCFYYQDYLRQGFLNSEFRLSFVNAGYQLSKTLPSLFIVPKNISDECLKKNCKFHRLNRLPIIVWKHPKLNSVLLRASGFNNKSFLGILIKNNANSTSQTKENEGSNLSCSLEQDKYINEIIKLTNFGVNNNFNMSMTMTPVTNRKNSFASKFERAVHTIKSNYINGTHSNNLEMDSNDYSLNDSFNSSFINQTQTTQNGSFQLNPLYIICEKSQAKQLRSNIENSKDLTRYVFIPVDIHEVKDTKNSFKKLLRACAPSTHSTDQNSTQQDFIPPNNYQHQHHQESQKNQSNATSTLGLKLNGSNKISRKKSSFNNTDHQTNHSNHNQNTFLKQLNDSKWFDQLQLIFKLTNNIIERIENGSSLMVCLEDGWDLTAQVVSLSELLLDPFYRTIEGFSMLIEREWLSMGHRFTRRNNHTVDDQTGFAPIFIQFLDLVHQLLHQYPTAFEFNNFYLEFLAYHSVSSRFSTFLLDNEYERAQFGLNLSNINISRTLSDQEKAKLFNCLNTFVCFKRAKQIDLKSTKSIWDFIIKTHFNCSVFFNFNYQPIRFSLRPCLELYKLKLWNYYYFLKDSYCLLYDYLDLALVSEQQSFNSQYEVLLKKILFKFNLLEIDFNKEGLNDIHFINELLSKLLNGANSDKADILNGINWKNLWDYFYDLAEKNYINSNQNNFFLCLTKPYLTTIQNDQNLIINKHLTLISSYSSKSDNSSTTYSSSNSSSNCTGSGTPPFPKIVSSNLNQNRQLSVHVEHSQILNQQKTNLDNSSYSIHTNTTTSSSSCSTTPNSNYSHNYRLDADIGSACALGLNGINEVRVNNGRREFEESIINKTNTTNNNNNNNNNSNSNNITNGNEHQTYAGYLKKQGALFKQWKERYFVLDSVKHQLRYYESSNDTLAKGVIDLSDVEFISQGLSNNYIQQHQQQQENGNSTKKVTFTGLNFITGDANFDSKNCFELKTSKRVYYFCAKTPQDAFKWVKQLEMCCTDS